MFCKYHRARFEHEDAMVPKLVAVKEVLRQGPTERTTADDDDVKGPRIWSPRCAAHCLVETVANISAAHLLSEIRELRAWTCHCPSPLFSSEGVVLERRVFGS